MGNNRYKFRAWDKRNLEMITEMYGFVTDPNKKRFRYFRLNESNPDGMGTQVGDSCDFELMQFTGFLDKNGKEIYEGDVLRGVSANEFSKGEINSYKIAWGVDHWHVIGTYFSLQELFNYTNKDLEVIGNIHENSELDN